MTIRRRQRCSRQTCTDGLTASSPKELATREAEIFDGRFKSRRDGRPSSSLFTDDIHSQYRIDVGVQVQRDLVLAGDPERAFG